MSEATLHQGQSLLTAGKPLADAKAVMILIHGRGATARDILSLATHLADPDYAYLAPQAANQTWYPYRFLEPTARNEPWLSSALQRVGELVQQAEGAGIPAARIVLAGFSQGACLASEFAARNARRYGGLLVFSGGLIGPPGAPRAYAGSLDGTPVFVGCSDFDPHIPLERVQETADVLERLGAQVTLRIYPNMGHTIIEDELEEARGIITASGTVL